MVLISNYQKPKEKFLILKKD
ncbi:UNVERIFIED_CONTAM: hypothetical protein GTU68_032372 [Idotea baltica]|nr:hypothetical protein [Idotea baltica]